MTAPETRAARQLRLASVLLPIAVIAAYLVLELPGLAPLARVAIAMVPLAAFAGFIVAEVRALRFADELQRRMQLEALAVAYPLAILLVYALGLLERAGVPVPAFTNLRDVWPLTVLPYVLGIALAQRRYR
jgi:hypothetical protein